MHNGRERASDSDKERPDNNGVFAAGDLAVLIDRKDRRFLVRLQPGRVAGSDAFGPLPHEAIIGRPPGSRLPAGPGRSVLCLRPTLEDYVLHMPRRSQVLYPKDLGLILSLGDVRPQS
ncbi:MAG: tRNA (adenine-N1)-methyltransferase, partial [Clostridia bacterium]|nr:tRNA (adenine-N1)-methyltransferase [Clostridia bacterium]